MKRGFYIMSAIMGCILLGTSCGNQTKDTTLTTDEKVKVKIRQVSVEDVAQTYEYTAIVEAEAVNNIAPLTGGRIDKIYYEVGDYVKKGQVLVQMNANSLKQSKSQLDNLELTFKRIDELYKVGGVSKSDWDAQKTNLEVLRTSYQNLAENTQLITPISGVITARNYDNGDLFAAQPILQVQQITPVKMLINVSENQYTKIKKGMSAQIKIEVFGDEEFAGRISLIYPTIDSKSHTFPVEVTLPNTNGKVRPGMYARVTINLGVEKRIVVPDVAIIKQQGSGERYIYVCKDNKVSYQKVEIGRRIGDSYELISGVSDGDMVVTTGHSRLNDGMQVVIDKD